MFGAAEDALDAAWLDHVRARRVIVWAAALVVGACVLAFLPLFNTVGFELAFATAIIASFASADLGATFCRRARTVKELADGRGPGRMVLAIYGRAAATNLALLIPPLLLISLNAVRVRTCAWGDGLTFYVLLPGLSSLWATGVGCFAALITGSRRRLSNALPHLILVALIALALWRFYAAPPVFSYSALAGYFPGNLYDEHIELSAAFYWARAHAAAWIVCALAAAAVLLDVSTVAVRVRGIWPLDRNRVWPVAMAVVAGFLACALWVKSDDLGFSVDRGDIAEALGKRKVTEHFIIYYPGGGEIERDIDSIAADHEFRYAQVVRALGAAPEGKITSFYFATAADKFRLIGARGVDMAKPWRNEIYVNHEPFPHPVLRHEIAHVVAGAFGAPIFRVSADTLLGVPVKFNVGLIEGIAVAADWPDHFTGLLTPHQSVKAMQMLGYAPPVSGILSPGFFSFSSSRSYTTAGSFVKFLLDTHGVNALQTLYRTGGDFEAAYGRPQTALIAEWHAMIDAVKLSPGAAEMVRERFRRPGIFSRPCPHAIASRRTEATRLAGRGKLDEAVDLLRGVCADAPGEPRFALELANLLRLAGHLEDGETIYERIAGDEGMTATLRAHALLKRTEIAARRGDLVAAERFLDGARALPIGDDYSRLAIAEHLAVTLHGPGGAALRDYFWGSPPRFSPSPAVRAVRAADVIEAMPASAMGYYLLGRTLVGHGAPAESANALSQALDIGFDSPLFERECARLLAAQAFLAGDYDEVLRAAEILADPAHTKVTQLYGADWRERVHFARHGNLP